MHKTLTISSLQGDSARGALRGRRLWCRARGQLRRVRIPLRGASHVAESKLKKEAWKWNTTQHLERPALGRFRAGDGSYMFAGMGFPRNPATAIRAELQAPLSPPNPIQSLRAVNSLPNSLEPRLPCPQPGTYAKEEFQRFSVGRDGAARESVTADAAAAAAVTFPDSDAFCGLALDRPHAEAVVAVGGVRAGRRTDGK